MPLLTVLTPTQAHNADHIGALWDSLLAQRLPSGWEWEWVVQEDGVTPGVAERLPADPRVRHDALGVQGGDAVTRNHGLARARGDLVAGIDHDDYYLPGGLAALMRPLLDTPDVAYAIGPCRLDLPDGGTWMREEVFESGRIPRRAVADHFLAHNDFPFVAGFTVYRRDVLVASGGWPAVARSSDAVLVASIADAHDGWWVSSPVAAYRRWDAQKTVQPADLAIRDLPHVRGIIGQRREATDRLRGR